MTQLVRVLLVRHGQTDWNRAGRWQGVLPVPLNEEGWSQARALATHLQGRSVSAIYSSDLPRAFQTAATIGKALGLEPTPDERWREFNLGIFQGLTREEIQERYPDEWRDFHTNYWDYVVPDGESRRMLQTRVHEAWTDVIHSTTASEAIVVTHGGAIRLLLLKLFEGAPELNDIHIENTSVTTIEHHGGEWRLANAAGTPHL
jgi:broad specificity phosphatase PhoE